MTTHENQPPVPGWQVESRPCPIPCSYCHVAETPTHSIWLHGTEAHLVLGEN